MDGRRKFTVTIAFLFVPLCATYLLAQDAPELLNESGIVFNGTVLRLDAVSFSEVPESPQTMVVEVLAVLKKPSSLSLKKGDKVTVKTKDLTVFKVGMQSTFYTGAWILGSGVAVAEIGHIALPVTGSYSKTPSESFSDSESQAAEAELRQLLNAAEVVVVGQVTDVHPWTGAIVSPQSPSAPISEHNPNWQEAVVSVQAAIKGTESKQIVIRFPKSRDVAWVNSPKFNKGQTGTFLLNADRVSGVPMAIMGDGQVPAYTALKAADVLPANEAPRIRMLLQK